MMLHVRVIGIVIDPIGKRAIDALLAIVAWPVILGATCAYLLLALLCLDSCCVRTGEQQRDIERISVVALTRFCIPGRMPTDSHVGNS
jgi:hypothetical protein